MYTGFYRPFKSDFSFLIQNISFDLDAMKFILLLLHVRTVGFSNSLSSIYPKCFAVKHYLLCTSPVIPRTDELYYLNYIDNYSLIEIGILS